MQKKIDETRKRAEEIGEVKKRNDERYKKKLFDLNHNDRSLEAKREHHKQQRLSIKNNIDSRT